MVQFSTKTRWPPPFSYIGILFIYLYSIHTVGIWGNSYTSIILVSFVLQEQTAVSCSRFVFVVEQSYRNFLLMLCCVHCTVDAVHGVQYTVHTVLVHCNILPHFKEAVPWSFLNSRFFILTMFSWKFSNNYLTVRCSWTGTVGSTPSDGRFSGSNPVLISSEFSKASSFVQTWSLTHCGFMYPEDTFPLRLE